MSTATVRTVDSRLIAPRFTVEEVHSASDEWGLNCGPAAVAAVCGMTLAGLRPHLGDFEQKHYTNPTLMWAILHTVKAPVLEIVRLNPTFEMQRTGEAPWPRYGLARVQWEGRWTDTGVPMRVRYRHTHWVGVDRTIQGEELNIFDVNCMCVGGWVPLSEWRASVVPWILSNCEAKGNNGRWHLTHVVEITRPLYSCI